MDLDRSGSLLKTVLDRALHDEAEYATFTRLLYVAELAKEDGAAERIAPFFNAFVAEEWARDSNMTGLLVVQESTCLHYVESQPETVVALMQALDANLASPEPLFAKGSLKIISCTEDAQLALFGQLLMVQHTFATGPAVDIAAEGVAEVSFAIASRLLRLAEELPPPDADRSQFEAARERVVTDHAALVPSDVAVKSLCACSDLMSLDEWLAVYATPVAVETHEAASHPMPPSLLTY
jgi:hypothetical protein